MAVMEPFVVYGAMPSNGRDDAVKRRVKFMAATALVLAVALAAVAATHAVSGEDAPSELLAPFESPPDYVWGSHGDSTLASELSAASSAWTKPGYSWTSAGTKAITDEIAAASSAWAKPGYAWTSAGTKAIGDEIAAASSTWTKPTMDYVWQSKGQDTAWKELVDYASSFKTSPDK